MRQNSLLTAPLNAPLHYRVHVAALACALGVLVLYMRFADRMQGQLLATFAVTGALHATALCMAVKVPTSWPRRLRFVMLAAVLCVLTLYIGIVLLQALGAYAAPLRLYGTLGVCAFVGAVTYGFLVRQFWMRALSPRPLLFMAVGCSAAVLTAYLAKPLLHALGGAWLAAVWWTAFSTGLYLRERWPRAHRAPPRS